MGWNGSGIFNRLYSWQSDKAAGINITASRMDGDTDDITSNGLGNCLTRDGQGQPTANLPMNTFRHTNVGNGQAATDYLAVGQLQLNGNATAIGIYGLADLGDIKPTALPEAILPTGWQICAGQTRPRTDPLWQKTGAVNAAYWVWGNGDGSTTYTLPDFRGRGLFGKDNMGGSAANRLTAAVSGVPGTTLGGTGGDQRAQPDSNMTMNMASPVSGSIGATSSASSSVTDPGHAHTYDSVDFSDGSGPNVSNASGQQQTRTTGGSGTGISVTTTVTTSVTDSRVVKGTPSLSGASQNIPPAAVTNFIIYCGA
jgi:microcystin-dependent protein